MHTYCTAMRFCLYIFLSILSLAANAQSGMHLQFLSRWDNDSLKSIGGQTFNDLWGWAAPDGKEYAIIGAVDSVYFIEVTDPLHPVVRSVQAGRFNECVHRDISSYSHYAYCVADEGNSSLQIFDMQYLPDSVHKVYDSDTLVSRAHCIFIGGGNIYFASPVTKENGANLVHALMVASLKNPEDPELLTTINANNNFDNVHDLYVRNDTAFLNCQLKGLWIYDFTKPENPTVITSIQNYPDEGFNHSSAVSPDGKTLVFTDETVGMRLKKYGLANLKKPRTVDRKPDEEDVFGLDYTKGSIAHNPYIKGRFIICSYYQDGVVVFDMNDSDKLVDYYDTYPQNGNTFSGFQGCWGVYPFLPSGTIIASDETNGLFCLRLDTITGIQKDLISVEQFNIYPNPCANSFSVSYHGTETFTAKLELFTLLGKRIDYRETLFSHELHSFAFTDLPALPTGIYLLKITTKTGDIVFKINKAE